MAPKATRPTKVTPTQHPLYGCELPIWLKLANVREGTGGFRDGTYLIAHPREWQDYTATAPRVPTKKLLARRALACYENIGGTIIEAKTTALFREQPSRTVGDVKDAKEGAVEASDLEQWWEDVDGIGTHVDDFLAHAWDAAATFGHVWIYMDRAKADPAAEPAKTAADAETPMLRLYTPIDVLDWLEDDRGGTTAVMFRECAPRVTFGQIGTSAAARYWTRVVNTTFWALYDENGELKEGGPVQGLHEMGVLPVVPLFAKRRPLISQIGQSVLGDPQLYVDVYNLTSEVRELLRNQTFSFINLPLGSGPDTMSVTDAQALIGQQTGTSNVLFSGLPAQMLSADAQNVVVYHDEINRRLRTIYRLAGIQWEADSKDAEASGSLKLKREDMNTRLSAYADEIELTDYAIAGLWYRASYGADSGVSKFDADQVVIRYPDSFDMTPFEAVLAQAQAAMSLGMPPVFLKALRKSLVSKFLPDLSQTDADAIEKAIEDAPDDLTPDQRLHARMTAMTGTDGQKAPPKKAAVPPPDPHAAA